MDGERPLVRVPRAEIVRLEVRYGAGAERPLPMLILGILLFAIALAPLVMLVNLQRHGGRYHVEWIAAVACAIPAAWLLDLSLRRRWLLVVHQRRGRRKLLFPRGINQFEVESFLAGARTRFGYSQ